VAQVVRIPVVGMGGITCLRDVLEFLLAGASAVQVGTANFSNPTTSVEIIDALETYCKEKKLRPADLVGKVQMNR
jgi:dihydroorotate dehydrogenase (NAD+) catalytic subunit